MNGGDASMRYKAMQTVKDWDHTRLGYRVVKRAFDIVFSGCVLAFIAVPSLVLAAAIRLESEGTRSTARSAWGRPTATAACPPSACGSSAACTKTPTSA